MKTHTHTVHTSPSRDTKYPSRSGSGACWGVGEIFLATLVSVDVWRNLCFKSYFMVFISQFISFKPRSVRLNYCRALFTGNFHGSQRVNATWELFRKYHSILIIAMKNCFVLMYLLIFFYLKQIFHFEI